MKKYLEYKAMTDRNIGPLIDLEYFIRTFEDSRLTEGLFQMIQACPFYRPVLGDGNCFYRAIAFSYLRQADLAQFSTVFKDIKNFCRIDKDRREIPDIMNDLVGVYKSYLKPIANTIGVARQNALVDIFNKVPKFDLLMIMYMRSLNYNEIENNADKYQPYIVTGQKERIVELYQQAEGVEVQAMAQALSIRITTNAVIPDGFHTFQYDCSNPKAQVNLIFRPGHYEIIYLKDSIYLQEADKKIMQSPTPNSPSSLLRNKSQPFYYQNQESYKFQQHKNNQFRRKQNQFGETWEQKNHQQSSRNLINPSRIMHQRIEYDLPQQRDHERQSNFDRQKNYFQNGYNNFHKQTDQRVSMYKTPSRDGLQSFDIRSVRDEYQKTRQNNKQTLKPSQPSKSRLSEQTNQAKRKSFNNAWETPEQDSDEKSKVKEFAVILLFFVVIGYVAFNFSLGK